MPSLTELFTQPPYAVPETYNTPLAPLPELQFRQWVADNSVPFDPNAGVTDYDMRGFWQALMQQQPRAVTAINANDGLMHYPDIWKTPLHQSFSADSQWANPATPRWNEYDQLEAPSGRIVFDERKR